MSSVTAWRRPLALGLWISTALFGPAMAGSAGGALLVAQTTATCADAKSHFEIAKEIGTREALQVHIDNYGDCPFAPFAKMMMDKLPAGTAATGTTPSAPAPEQKAVVETPAAPAVDVEAVRVADAFVALLNEAPKAIGEPDGYFFSYETATSAGADIRIAGLQYRKRQTTSRQTRIRFDETLLVHPRLSAGGGLSADRIEASGLQTTERGPGKGAWVPFRNSDKFQFLGDRITVTDAAILSKNDSAEDALGQRFRMKSLDVKALRLESDGKPVMALDSLTAEIGRIEKGLPYKMTGKADGVSFSRAFLERSGGDEKSRQAMAALGFDDYVFGLQGDFEADSAKRTVSLNRLSASMKNGFGSAVIIRLSDVDLAEVFADLVAGSRRPASLRRMNVDFTTVSYFDTGLFPKVVDVVVAMSGLDAGLLKSVAPAQAQAAAFGFFADQKMADDIRDAVSAFLATPRSLGVTFAPARPLNVWTVASQGLQHESVLRRTLVDLRTSVQVNQQFNLKIYRPLLLASLPAETREAIDACHRLAADSDDPQRLAPGIKSPNDIDFAKALPVCETAQKADPSDPLLAFELGRTYYASGNPTLANSFYNLAAVGGHDVAKFELASARLNGSGMTADPEKAIAEFTAIADKLPIARSLLASLYSEGTGVPADPKKAIEIWQAGADKGEAPSEYNLAIEYILGTNVAADPLKGREYLQKAADQGHADAMAELGKSLFRGDGGTTPDYPTAFRWAEKAADAGSTIGEANAGYMLATGLGVPEKNPEKAAVLLLAALSKGDTDAEAYLITDKAKDLDKTVRKAVQTQMKKDGTYNGPTTGLFGRQTMDALEAIRDAGRS